jgi:AbiV family abortive infection protein
LSLAVLALEDLAKVPLLYSMAFIGPDASRWKKYWGDFTQHKIKQERMTQYGGLLASAGNSPYGVPITPAMVSCLDTLKQSGFYVDCVDGQFVSPEDLTTDMKDVLDYVFAAVEERVDSFAQMHATQESSEAFSREGIEDVERVFKKSGGNPTLADFQEERESSPPPKATSEAELAGRVRSLAARFSTHEPGTPGVPDYFPFYSACESMLGGYDNAMVAAVLSGELRCYRRRMKVSALPTSAYRATMMFKLIFGYLRQADPWVSDQVTQALQADEQEQPPQTMR